MIGRMLTDPYGNVRARALATRLLSRGELLDLAGSGSGDRAASEIERRLSRSEDGLSLDRRLQADYRDYALLILKSLPDRLRDLFRTYLDRPWLENLLALCRHVAGGPAGPPPLLPVMGWQPPLPGVDDVGGLPEIGASLPEGPYREALLTHPDESAGEEPTGIENRLIRAYWGAVAQRVERLPGADGEAAGEILGRRADVDALRILLRGVDRGLDPDRILELWPPPAAFLDLDRLRRTLRSSAPREGVRRLLERALGGLEEDRYETALRRRLHRLLLRRLLAPPFGISVPLSALLLKELEVADLQGLLGGLRFELDRDTLQAIVADRKG